MNALPVIDKLLGRSTSINPTISEATGVAIAAVVLKVGSGQCLKPQKRSLTHFPLCVWIIRFASLFMRFLGLFVLLKLTIVR